jgi:hypothetical protein
MRAAAVVLLLAGPTLGIDLLEKLFGFKDFAFGKVDKVGSSPCHDETVQVLGGIFGKDNCGCPCRDYFVAKCQVPQAVMVACGAHGLMPG